MQPAGRACFALCGSAHPTRQRGGRSEESERRLRRGGGESCAPAPDRHLGSVDDRVSLRLSLSDVQFRLSSALPPTGVVDGVATARGRDHPPAALVAAAARRRAVCGVPGAVPGLAVGLFAAAGDAGDADVVAAVGGGDAAGAESARHVPGASGAGRHPPLFRAGARWARLAGRHWPAAHRRGVHRHRRQLSGAGVCVRGAAQRCTGSTSRSRPSPALLGQRGSGGCDPRLGRPAARDDPGGGGEQDVHHRGDHAERAHPQTVDCGRAGRARGRATHGGGEHQHRGGGGVWHRPAARHVRFLGLGRWSLLGMQCSGPGAAVAALRFCSDAAPGAAEAGTAHSAGGHGEQRQAGAAGRARSVDGRCHRGGEFRRARHQRPALLLPADAPGTRGAGGLYRFPALADAAHSARLSGEQPRRADEQLFCAAGCAGRRQIGRAAASGGRARVADTAQGVRRQPTFLQPAVHGAGRVHPWRAAGAVRAPHLRRGLYLGAEQFRPVGRRAGQGAGQARAPGAPAAPGQVGRRGIRRV
eukprot:ctg_756.g365